MPNKLKKRIFAGLIVSLLFANSAQAGSPVIIRHDAHLMEREIRINLAWQSDEPVARIIASAGKEQIVVDRNIDNERNESGYSGEIDVVVPAYPDGSSNTQSVYINQQNMNNSMTMSSNTPSPYSEVVPYSVQLVDEINQRSMLLKDSVKKAAPVYQHSEQRPRPNPSGSTTVIDVKDPLNTAVNATIELLGKKGAIPVIKSFNVLPTPDNQFVVEFEAVDDKGVDKVVFEVRNSAGSAIPLSQSDCNSEKTCVKQSDPFILSPGKNMISIMAIDSDGNKSKKQIKELQVSNLTDTAKKPSDPGLVGNVPSVTQPSLSPSPDKCPQGVCYESL